MACVTCPWHGYEYRLEDGCAPPPFTEKLATYRVRLRDGMIEVDPNALPPGTTAAHPNCLRIAASPPLVERSPRATSAAMNILLLGSGGREHALAWKIAASPLTTKLWCAPGNAGIARRPSASRSTSTDHAAVVAFCRQARVDFVVVGPDAPLVAGIVDDLEAAGFKTFGPTKAAARLEGSKGFTKDLCRRTASRPRAYERFTDAAPAKAYARAQGAPIVVKADGLAAGQGRHRRADHRGGRSRDRHDVRRRFRRCGREVVIEEFLSGEEVSFFALCDGETAIPLASAQDHKRAFDGDKGPNTGGMGAYSPAPVFTDDARQRDDGRVRARRRCAP